MSPEPQLHFLLSLNKKKRAAKAEEDNVSLQVTLKAQQDSIGGFLIDLQTGKRENVRCTLCLGRLEFEKESMVLEWKKMEDDFRKVQSKGAQLQSEVEGLKRELHRLQMKEVYSSLPPETSEVA